MTIADGTTALLHAIASAAPLEQRLGTVVSAMIGFGPDAAASRPRDVDWVQHSLDQLLPGYQVLDATAHDWLADPYSAGAWAIHRPGCYEHCHAAMQAPEDRVLFAGSDIANGWAGFIDGAIETGLKAGARAAALSRS